MSTVCVVLVRDRVLAVLLSYMELESIKLIQPRCGSVSPFIRTHFGSMSGLAQFVAARGLGTLQEWCEEGYKAVARIDEDLSGEFCV